MTSIGAPHVERNTATISSTAPFRIVRRARQAGGGGGQDGIKDWVDRLIKLIPSEVTAAYLALRGPAGDLAGWWALACVGLVIMVRVWGTSVPGKGPQWPAVAIAAVSFVIWVYVTGGQIATWPIKNQFIPSAAVVVWTFIVPHFYHGD
jgi:hypothetical protein